MQKIGERDVAPRAANQQILIVPKAATARCFRAVGIEVKALSGSHTESISGAFADGALIVLPNDLAICARRIAVIRRLGERWRHDASRRDCGNVGQRRLGEHSDLSD